MEVFIPGRQPDQAFALMARLRELGIGGRDAAYLATVLPPQEWGTPEMACYIKELEFIVALAERPAAARLLGLPPLHE